MAPRRKSMKRKTGKQSTRKATTRYVVTGKFTLITDPISKKEADSWAAKVKRKGGTAVIKRA